MSTIMFLLIGAFIMFMKSPGTQYKDIGTDEAEYNDSQSDPLRLLEGQMDVQTVVITDEKVNPTVVFKVEGKPAPTLIELTPVGDFHDHSTHYILFKEFGTKAIHYIIAVVFQLRGITSHGSYVLKVSNGYKDLKLGIELAETAAQTGHPSNFFIKTDLIVGSVIAFLLVAAAFNAKRLSDRRGSTALEMSSVSCFASDVDEDEDDDDDLDDDDEDVDDSDDAMQEFDDLHGFPNHAPDHENQIQ